MRLMRKRYLALIALAALVVAAGFAFRGDDPHRVQAQAIVSNLDPSCLGCGPDAYTGGTSEHAMAFALLTSVGASLPNAKLMHRAATWLLQNSTPSTGKTGWGLSFAWDAFGDGSKNPVDTVYGITTALAVRGLLDAYEEEEIPAYLETALAALTYYSRFFTETPQGGYFWYSDQESDAINTYNVSAMLLGQYARAGVLAGRADLVQIAKSAMEDLLAHSQQIEGFEYWPYSPKATRPNDAVHAAYIVQGLIDFKNATGQTIDLNQSINYLPTFANGDQVFEFSTLHNDLDTKLRERPARLWGVGMLAFTLAEAGEIEASKVVLVNSGRYMTSPGLYSNLPGSVDEPEPRMTSHLALAASRLSKLRRNQSSLARASE